jgi:hypothetical protein
VHDEIKAKGAAEREAELKGKHPQHGAMAGIAGR